MPLAPNAKLAGTIAISADSGIKPLGYIGWFSVPDESVSLRKLKQALMVNGLPPSLAPKDQKGVNTFKRAMREQEGKQVWQGKETETTIRAVVETPDEVVYQISRVVRDLKDRVIEYPKGMRVIFNKATEEIRYNTLKNEDAEQNMSRAEQFEVREAIQEFYDKNATKITGARVRGIVRNYLQNEPDETRNIEGLSGENLRGRAGGIYFVPAEHVGELQSLSDMLTELYGGRAFLHAIPLADGASEREIIRRHHVTNTREEIKEAMAEAKKLLAQDRDRALRSDYVANQWAKFRALERRAAKYRDLLNDEQEEITEMAGLLNKQLDKLLG
jgi:hypothetical protein